MNITFCINTARGERNHIELLFRSLYKNLSRRDYPILVFVENDTEGTVEFLVTQKPEFPNLKIIINPLPVPVGCSRNINMMFEMAETEVVSYLQSDMIICPLYDLEIAKLVAPDTVVSATRIEPPLHPPSPEKITHDFGLDPTKFDLCEFSRFAAFSKSDKVTDFWFAPFTLYKKAYLDIGGYDTLLRRSRDDSDLLYRFSLLGLKTKQSWNALVYHFTCTSSRGVEWWTEKAKARTKLQELADVTEMKRFLRKWGRFKHSSVFNPETEYKYQISANFYNVAPTDFSLFQYYYLFHRIYIDDPKLRLKYKEFWEQWHDAANDLLNISASQWAAYKKYYRTWEYEDIFSETPIENDDIIYNVQMLQRSFDTMVNQPVFAHNQELIHAYRTALPGEYEMDGTMVKIQFNRVVNRIQENLVVKNPPVDDVVFEVL